MMSDFETLYALRDDEDFEAEYRARCRCGQVRYAVSAESVDAKICHCRGCQTLHGAPMQWAAIFEKHHVRFLQGTAHLRFYSSAEQKPERILPCKVSCARCGTPIADEGRRIWLAFPTLFDFGQSREIPLAFRPSCHIFYGARSIDVADDLPKWAGHKEASALL